MRHRSVASRTRSRAARSAGRLETQYGMGRHFTLDLQRTGQSVVFQAVPEVDVRSVAGVRDQHRGPQSDRGQCVEHVQRELPLRTTKATTCPETRQSPTSPLRRLVDEQGGLDALDGRDATRARSAADSLRGPAPAGSDAAPPRTSTQPQSRSTPCRVAAAVREHALPRLLRGATDAALGREVRLGVPLVQ
ncbi:hypothetical protein WQ59_07710 [Streptomyces sp. KE1]|nr:hypothetical protein WQ59_07710 [Streptomyces sp. KE1]